MKSFAVVALLAGAVCGCQPGAATALTASQRSELATLKSQLADPSRSSQTKLEAAEMLLSRTYPQAAEALDGFLKDSTNPSAQLAVAQAIARRGGGGRMLIGPLVSMLKEGAPSVRAAAGRALASYGTDDVTERLIAIASGKAHGRTVRLVAIRSLAGVQQRRVVAALITLMSERDPSIQEAAAETLAKLTGIGSLGADPVRWNDWWARNKHKSKAEWLSELAGRLGRSTAALEAQNAALRERLGEAMRGVYEATPPAQRNAMLAELLKDPLAEVRLVGVGVIDQKLSANEAIAEEVRPKIRAMLSDEDPRCRSAAALLTAQLGDDDSLRALLERMEVEPAAKVRRGLLTALGQLRKAKALAAVLPEISSPSDEVAAAAAEALARIAEAHPLGIITRTRAVRALSDRYRQAAVETDGEELREALLTAMGTVGDRGVVGVVRGALKDRAATVRLAAVVALGKVGDARLAALLLPLAADEDRGVRQAAISVLGGLAGQKHLDTIIDRTDVSVEVDAAVRRQAWQAAMAVLAKSDPKVLRRVADGLAHREDAADQRIQILDMLVESLAGAGDAAESDARKQLGLALMRAGRPAEAGPYLEQAWRIQQARRSDQAEAAWHEWIGSLLAADDPAVIEAMKSQTSDRSFALAADGLAKRLSKLNDQGSHSAVFLLAESCLRELSDRLTGERRKAFAKLADQARIAQMAGDRLEVGKLVALLTSADEAVRTDALSRLAAMGGRATPPLLLELKKVAQATEPNGQAEQAIVAAIVQAAPDFDGYDPAAEKGVKIKLIEEYLQTGG